MVLESGVDKVLHILSFRRGLFFVVLLIIPFISLKAQNELLYSTIDQAKEIISLNKLDEAKDLLSDFENKYPGSLWIEQLYASCLHQLKDYHEADIIYRRALEFHPDNSDLKYGYGLLLFDMNKLDQSKKWLEAYSQEVKNNAKAEALLGKLYYWDKNFNSSFLHLQRARELDPINEEIKELYEKVYRLCSHQFSINPKLRDDTQPMLMLGTNFTYAKYISSAFDIKVSNDIFNYTQIPQGNRITSLFIGNTFHINKINAELLIEGGGYNWKSDTINKWRAKIAWKQKISRNIYSQVLAERKLYDFTVASIETPTIMNQLKWFIAYEKTGGWTGQLGVQYQYFEDNNIIKAYYLWVLSRPILLKKMDLSFGLSSNFMDSEIDHFKPKKTINEIQQGNQRNKNIDGVYDPYFTPLQQLVNSILGNINYHFSSKTHLNIRGSFGIFSTAEVASFSIETNSAGEDEFVKTYSTTHYKPFEFQISFHNSFSKKFELELSYGHERTYYYDSNQFNLGFNFYF